MRGITRMENGKEVEYVNSELIPGFLYLPREVMDCFPTEVRNLSRRIPDLLYDPKSIAVVESSLFTNSVSAGFSILSWFAMGQPEQTPESYSENDPAYLISMTASLWITGLEFIRILPDAVEWKAMHQNVDKSFGYPTMDQAMLYMYALVPRLMVILHIDQAIQIAREFPCHEDFSKVSSTQKRDFLRKWNHSRAKTAVLSLESLVMRAVFGENMVNGNLAKVETNRFARADLEHALVMVDDDMKMEGLPDTNYLKMIITAELPLDLERKGQQSYQGELYARFMGFGNGSIKALYDRSHGFFRRQIILTAKKRAPDRVDDPNLSEKLTADPEGLFLWCYYGLQRLMERNYRFTVSDQARANMEAAVSEGNNVVDFMASRGYLNFFTEAETSTKELYADRLYYCRPNGVDYDAPLSDYGASP